MRLACFLEMPTLIPGTGADKSSETRLFHGMRRPPDTSAEQEDREGCVLRQAHRADEHRQGGSRCWATRRSHPARTPAICASADQVIVSQQGPGRARLRSGKRMAEAGEETVAIQPGPHGLLRAGAGGFVNQPQQRRGRAAMPWTRQSAKACQEAGRDRGTGGRSNPGCEGRSVQLVVGDQDEGLPDAIRPLFVKGPKPC